MIFKANCYYCDSGDLKIIDITLGAGTEGERTKRIFKCNSCDEELDLDEIIFEEVDKSNLQILKDGLSSAT